MPPSYDYSGAHPITIPIGPQHATMSAFHGAQYSSAPQQITAHMYQRQIRPANALPAHMCNMQSGSTPSPLCSPQLMYMYGLGDGMSSPGSFSSVHSDLSDLATAHGCLPSVATPGSVVEDPMNFAMFDTQGVAQMSQPAMSVGTPMQDLTSLQSEMAGLSLPSQWATPTQLPVNTPPAASAPFNALSESPPILKRHKRSDTSDSAPLLERSSVERSSLGASPESPIPQAAVLGNTYTFSPNTQFSAPQAISSLFPSIENNSPLVIGNGGNQAYIDLALQQGRQDPNLLLNDKFMEFLMLNNQSQMVASQGQQPQSAQVQQSQAVQPGIAPELTMNHASANNTPSF
ncbi:hypothetical protein DL89DRAFT_185004 [Linderina pennispora]|uniref:Uncharacterized protein n=1 Tax=Linderina pennispora TaxID=61395 RepID=A0A1Y1W5L8_9FUNG|nr:uncharacterized protein DL89DRAFT_185004 [Linderina pennispora]ORX68841.1 hypothetical protein DL89DRAFT_185004 [Linderina pennispora]